MWGDKYHGRVLVRIVLLALSAPPQILAFSFIGRSMLAPCSSHAHPLDRRCAAQHLLHDSMQSVAHLQARARIIMQDTLVSAEGDEDILVNKVNIQSSLVGGGLGVFARLHFAVGDEIIRESPLVVLQDHLIESAGSSYLEMVISNLPSTRSFAVRNLSDAHGKDHESTIMGATLMGIVATNCIPITEESTALFATICRINHSCKPNARFLWRDDLNKMVVLALRPISPGKEVTLHYRGESIYLPCSERQKLLKDLFNFDCKCEFCTASTPFRDSKLAQIQRQIDAVPNIAAHSLLSALALCEHTLLLMREQGFDTPADLGRYDQPAIYIICLFSM